MRRTRAWSAWATTTFEPFLRFELRLSATMPCRRCDERRIALPVPESLNRFRAARLDFILGISDRLLRGSRGLRRLTRRAVLAGRGFDRGLHLLPLGPQPERHGAALGPCRLLHHREIGEVAQDLLDDAVAELLVGHLPPPERHGELHLVPLLEERARVLQLEVVVVVLDLGTHLHFLELHVV